MKIINEATYTYAVDRKEKRLIRWVLSARGKDKARPAMTYVQVEDGYIVATDGWSLHRAHMPVDMPGGIYNMWITGDHLYVDPVQSLYPDITKVTQHVSHGNNAHARTRLLQRARSMPTRYGWEDLPDSEGFIHIYGYDRVGRGIADAWIAQVVHGWQKS